MVQINDDYYEDLTPESTVKLLTALQEAASNGETHRAQCRGWQGRVDRR